MATFRADRRTFLGAGTEGAKGLRQNKHRGLDRKKADVMIAVITL